jgi:hypothetical protein
MNKAILSRNENIPFCISKLAFSKHLMVANDNTSIEFEFWATTNTLDDFCRGGVQEAHAGAGGGCHCHPHDGERR